MVELLANVPDSVWGALVGAIIALGGVALSNRSAMQRLSRELQHATEERRAERDAQVRKEVFQNAVDALAGFAQHLGSFGNLQNDPQQLAPSAGGALAKVQLIATGETLQVVQAANAIYARSAFELALARGKAIGAQNQLSAVNRLLGSGQVPADRVAALYAARDRLQQQAADSLVTHLRTTLDRVVEYGEALIPVTLRFREELDMPIEEEVFQRHIRDTLQALRELTARFIEDLEAARSPPPPGAPPAA